MKLKVAEAIQEDVNKGIVRIDSSFLRELDIRVGNIVEIKGEKTTVAIVDRSLPGDLGLNIIRMDGLIRRNAKITIGELVEIRKADVKEAKKVTIAPAKKGVLIKASPEVFKQGLLGRAVMKGDIVSLGGTNRRRTTLAGNPLYDDVFSMLGDTMAGFGLGDLKFIVVDAQPKQAVLITEHTQISYNPEAQEVREDVVIDISYEDVGGLESEIKKIREMIELPLKHPEVFERLGINPPTGVLLYGPPGTGKTLIAKAVANETSMNFVTINGPEIMSKYYGQSEENLRKIFEEANKNGPSIIFIDEIDAIASKREESKGDVEKRVVAQLLALMDGLSSSGKVVVMAASNIPNSLEPALRRPGRFDRELEIGVPSKEGRLDILKIHTRNMPLAKSVSLKKIADTTHGFVGADLAALAREAALIVLKTTLPNLNLEKDDSIPQETLEKLQITNNDFQEAMKLVKPSALREVFVEIPNIKWVDIGGLQDVKQELIEAVEWPLNHPEIFTNMGIRPPKGILLYGPPGTGKTLLAKAVANESKANFISVKGPEILSKWVNETPQLVKRLFSKARQSSPSIIFIDEIDSIAASRTNHSRITSGMDAVNSILTEMDGVQELNEVVVIAATNRPDILDTALLRPGRFDRIIMVGAPNKESREKIFEIHTKKMPLAKDVSIKKLVDMTDNYVGADIESVCREAAILALRKDIKAKEIPMEFFEEALKKVRPSVSKEIDDAYRRLKDQFTSARAKQMDEEKPSYYG